MLYSKDVVPYNMLYLIHFWNTGVMFGYPKCCIESFMHQRIPHDMKPGRLMWGTGFVPCFYCGLTKTEEELVAYINKNRKHPKSFGSNVT